MKQYFVAGMILLATATAVLLHARKIKDLREAPDQIAYSLKGLEQHLQPDRSLNLRLGEGVPGEAFLYARLALAPRHVELIRSHDLADTFLLIKVRQQVDTQSARAQSIWSASDDTYDYQLLSNP